MLYFFTNTKQPTPGAMSYAFHMRFGLPQFTPSTPGIPVHWTWNSTQPQQVYYNKRVPVSGYGGVVADGIRTSALSQNQLGLDAATFG